MGIKSRSSKASIVSILVQYAISVWIFFIRFIEAATLPDDTSTVWKSIVSAPEIIPWVILAISMVILVWSIWPSKAKPPSVEDDASMSVNVTTGDNSTSGDIYAVANQGSGTAIGRVDNINIGQQRFDLTDGLLNQIASDLDKERPVELVISRIGRSPELGKKLEEFLRNSGFEVRISVTFGREFPINLTRPITAGRSGIQGDGATLYAGKQVIILDASVV